LRRLHISLEIGERTIRLAWARPLPGGKRAWRYVEHPRSRPEDAASLAADLRLALRPLRAAHLNAHVVLAAPHTHLRAVRLRVASRDVLAEALRQRLPTLLPFEAGRARTQFRILKEERRETGWDYTVQVASCEISLLQEQLGRLWEAEWVPRHVCPPGLALSRAAAELHQLTDDPLLILHIDHRATTMVLMHNRDVVFARDVALGTAHVVDALTHQVAVGGNTVQLSQAQAETLLQRAGFSSAEAASTHGLLPPATYAALVQPVLEQLASEMQRTVTFGVQSAEAAMPTRVLLSGEGVRLPQVESWCRQQMSLPVERLSCQAAFGELGSHAAIIYGLALHEGAPMLDLQLPVVRKRRSTLRFVRFACHALVGLVLAMWLSIGGLMAQDGTLRRTRTALEARWAQLSPVVSLQGRLDTHDRLVDRLVEEQGVPFNWLRRLADGFPDAVRLSRLVARSERIDMEGEGQARTQTPEAHVSELVLWLQRAKVCRNVQRLNVPGGGSGLRVTRFALTCRLP